MWFSGVLKERQKDNSTSITVIYLRSRVGKEKETQRTQLLWITFSHIKDLEISPRNPYVRLLR
jgi:hypothetical protein